MSAGNDGLLGFSEGDSDGPLFLSTLSPPKLASNVNDYPIGRKTFVRLEGSAQRTVTGFAGGREGRVLWLQNSSLSFNLVLSHESTSSFAENRLFFSDQANYTMLPRETALCIYDGTISRWRVFPIFDLARSAGHVGSHGTVTTTITPVYNAVGPSFEYNVNTNSITDSLIRQSAGLSVIGRSANSTGNVADITAASDGQVLRRSGTSIGFGAVNLASANAVTGALPVANLGALNGFTDVEPAMLDVIPCYDASGSANGDFTVEKLLGWGLPGTCVGRLTTESGVAVSTSNRTSQGTIYFTPIGRGSRVGLYDGTRWKLYAFSEVSLALSISSGTNYDVFLYDNAGTLTLELTAWTNDTTRATALTTQDGVYVKNGATTRRYLGTIRGSGANVTEDSTSRRFVWNFYNQVARPMKAVDTTNSWTYSSATYREANGGSTDGTSRIAYVSGIADTLVEAHVQAYCFDSIMFANVAVGVGIDSATNAADTFGSGSNNSPGGWPHARYRGYPGLGYHTVRWLEASQTGNTTTWYGDNGGAFFQSGLTAEIWG